MHDCSRFELFLKGNEKKGKDVVRKLDLNLNTFEAS